MVRIEAPSQTLMRFLRSQAGKEANIRLTRLDDCLVQCLCLIERIQRVVTVFESTSKSRDWASRRWQQPVRRRPFDVISADRGQYNLYVQHTKGLNTEQPLWALIGSGVDEMVMAKSSC